MQALRLKSIIGLMIAGLLQFSGLSTFAGNDQLSLTQFSQTIKQTLLKAQFLSLSSDHQIHQKTKLFKEYQKAKRTFFDELNLERSLTGTPYIYEILTPEKMTQKIDQAIGELKGQLDFLKSASQSVFMQMPAMPSYEIMLACIKIEQIIEQLNMLKSAFTDKVLSDFLFANIYVPIMVFTLATSGHYEKRQVSQIVAKSALGYIASMESNLENYSEKEISQTAQTKSRILQFINTGIFQFDDNIIVELSNPKIEAKITFSRTFDRQMVKDAPAELFLYDLFFGQMDRLITKDDEFSRIKRLVRFILKIF